MALWSNQPLREMSTRFISWGKGGRCVRLTNLPPSGAVVMKSGNLNFLKHSGPLQACNGIALPLTNFVVTSSEVLTSECFDENKSFFLYDVLSYCKQYCGMVTLHNETLF
jgi:hypothetical protein